MLHFCSTVELFVDPDRRREYSCSIYSMRAFLLYLYYVILVYDTTVD